MEAVKGEVVLAGVETLKLNGTVITFTSILPHPGRNDQVSVLFHSNPEFLRTDALLPHKVGIETKACDIVRRYLNWEKVEPIRIAPQAVVVHKN
ncbi:hypothetical protein GTO10_01765 [Candidatus Saccharibacteria bacterium]|nr:hypothetical protein [Candidatus Saccharibacteria bacterium]